jgi:hypothetical protein
MHRQSEARSPSSSDPTSQSQTHHPIAEQEVPDPTPHRAPDLTAGKTSLGTPGNSPFPSPSATIPTLPRSTALALSVITHLACQLPLHLPEKEPRMTCFRLRKPRLQSSSNFRVHQPLNAYCFLKIPQAGLAGAEGRPSRACTACIAIMGGSLILCPAAEWAIGKQVGATPQS